MGESVTPATSLLKQSVKAVPAVKYALGIAGVIAVIAIVKSFGIDYRVAAFGAVIMLVLMTMLVTFSRLAAKREGDFRLPALIFTWFALVLTMATAVALFSSVFWGSPLELRYKGPLHEIEKQPQPAVTSPGIPNNEPNGSAGVKTSPSTEPGGTDTQAERASNDPGPVKSWLGTWESRVVHSTAIVVNPQSEDNGKVIGDPREAGDEDSAVLIGLDKSNNLNAQLQYHFESVVAEGFHCSFNYQLDLEPQRDQSKAVFAGKLMFATGTCRYANPEAINGLLIKSSQNGHGYIELSTSDNDNFSGLARRMYSQKPK